MGNRYRGRAALALIACLPCAPAWAASVADRPDGSVDPLRDSPPISLVNVALDGPPLRTDAAATSFRHGHSDSHNDDLMPMDWDLTDVGSAGEPEALAAALPEAIFPEAIPVSRAEASPPSDMLPASSNAVGPPVPLDRSGHVPREYAAYRGFFQQAGTSTTEIAILSGYVLAQGIPKLFKPTTSFHFKDEGWFGKNTQNVGMDKLTHAFNTYVIAELLHYRIHRNTDASQGDALTAALLASGLMALNEISDAIEPDSGYSMQDITMNIAGAAFSVLRNTVPGLKEKLAFKIEIMPNDQIYSHAGKPHYEQERFMFSLKGAGFETLKGSVLKYLDLQVGYFGSDFLNSDREKGITPKRHLFVGVGLNLGELLFAQSGSRIGRAAYSVLDYVQLPYTSLRYDSTGRLAY